MVLIRTLLFLFLLLILPDWYIHHYYVRKYKHRWLKILYWIPTAILLTGMLYIFISHDFGQASMIRLSYFILLFLIVTVPKVLFSLIMLVFAPFRLITKRKLFDEYVAILAALYGLGAIIYGATEGKQHFQIREVTIEYKDLPASFDGYRILQISDIHSGSWTDQGKALQRAINLCNAQQADLAVFTGDLVNNLASEADPFMSIFRQLSAKDGVYSILGNHDYSTYIRWKDKEAQAANLKALEKKQEEIGWHLLLNEHVILHHGNDSIILAGVENSGNPPFPDFGDLSKALNDTEGMFKILLSHDPTHWRRNIIPETDVQLTLSGHTHEMQCTFWGFCPIKFVYPEHNGLYREGNQALFVNIGLGHVMFPLRIGAWPEITVITLRKSAN